jgi:hypothetical protein
MHINFKILFKLFLNKYYLIKIFFFHFIIWWEILLDAIVLAISPIRGIITYYNKLIGIIRNEKLVGIFQSKKNFEK